MTLRVSACAIHLSNDLGELRKKQQLESLRPYLIEENCFPQERDVNRCPITMDELKKLAKAWKMSERKLLSKGITDITDLVFALLQHLHNDRKFHRKVRDNSPINNVMSIKSGMIPTAPSTMKPSTPAASELRLKNICGLKHVNPTSFLHIYMIQYFNKEENDKEMLLRSRVYGFPTTGDTVNNLVNEWRIEDFKKNDDTFQLDMPQFNEYGRLSANNSPKGKNLNLSSPKVKSPKTKGIKTSESQQSQQPQTENDVISPLSSDNNVRFHFTNSLNIPKKISNKANEQKHRNLAVHLARFSSSTEFQPENMTLSSIQTFVSVSESEDSQVATYSIISLGNISLDSRIRQLLLDVNVILKASNLIPFIIGQKAIKATAIFFYYFSCDNDIEDRIYVASIPILESNGQSNNPELRLLAMYTFNNLLPCLDREHVTSTIMNIINGFLHNAIATCEYDSNILYTYTKILENCTKYITNHENLLKLEIFQVITQIIDLLDKSPCNEADVSKSKVIESIVPLILQFQRIHDTTTSLSTIACNAARYLSNISRPISQEYLNLLIHLNVPQAILHIIELYKQSHPAICSIAMHGLQNILSMSFQSNHLISMCYDTIIYMIENNNDVGAIYGLYNLTCDSNADINMEYLVHRKCHIIILDYLCRTELVSAKIACMSLLIGLISTNKKGKSLSNQKSDRNDHNYREDESDDDKPLSLEEEMNIINSIDNTKAKDRAKACILDLVELDLLIKLENILPCFEDLSVTNSVWEMLSQFLYTIVSSEPSIFLGSHIEYKNITETIESKDDQNNKMTIMDDKIVKKRGTQSKIKQVTYTSHPVVKSIERISSFILKKIPLKLLQQSHILSQHVSSLSSSSALSLSLSSSFISSTELSDMKKSSEDIVYGILQVIGSMSEQLDEFHGIASVIELFIHLMALIKPIEKSLHLFANILFNISCHSAINSLGQKSITDLLVSNKYYLTILLDLMRCNFLDIQIKIASTLRNFCIQEECIVFLSNKALLSDLIVIALLRTSHILLKNTCIDIFYNMLCHENTRLGLLKGEDLDLWWSIHRLSHHPSKYIKYICSNNLYDLSLEEKYTNILRTHHVFTFLRDLIYDICSSEEVLKSKAITMLQLTLTDENGETKNDGNNNYNDDDKKNNNSSSNESNNENNTNIVMEDEEWNDTEDRNNIHGKIIYEVDENNVESIEDVEKDIEYCQRCLDATQNMIAYLQDMNLSSLSSTTIDDKTVIKVKSEKKLIGKYSKEEKTLIKGSYSMQYGSHEIIALIRITASTIGRLFNCFTISSAISILLIASQHIIDGCDMELIQLNIISLLLKSKHLWSSNYQSCAFVSAIIYEITSKSEVFTKYIKFLQYDGIWNSSLNISAINRIRYANNIESNQINSEDIIKIDKQCEYISGTILLYLQRKLVENTKDVIQMKTWLRLLHVTFGVPYPFQGSNSSNNSSTKSSGRSSCSFSVLSSPIGNVSRNNSSIDQLSSSLLTEDMTTQMNLSNEIPQSCSIQSRVILLAVISQLAQDIINLPDRLPIAVMKNIMTTEHITNYQTRDHLILIIYKFSFSTQLCEKMLDSSDVFELLQMYLLVTDESVNKGYVSFESISNMKIIELCSIILFNLSNHKTTISKMLIPKVKGWKMNDNDNNNSSNNNDRKSKEITQAKSCTSSLEILIEELLQSHRIDENGNKNVHFHIVSCLYQIICGHALKEDYTINPKYSLTTLQRITGMKLSSSSSSLVTNKHSKESKSVDVKSLEVDKNRLNHNTNSNSSSSGDEINKDDDIPSTLSSSSSSSSAAAAAAAKVVEIGNFGHDDSTVAKEDDGVVNNENENDEKSVAHSIPTASITPIPLIDVETMNVGRYAINQILEKYPHNVGVNPEFVQSLFTEMMTNSLQHVPILMSQMKCSKFSNQLIDLYESTDKVNILLQSIQSMDVRLSKSIPRLDQWNGIRDIIPKTSNEHQGFLKNEPILSLTLDSMDPISTPSYFKYIHIYDPINIDTDVSDITTNSDALVEGDEEEEEGEDEDEDKDEDEDSNGNKHSHQRRNHMTNKSATISRRNGELKGREESVSSLVEAALLIMEKDDNLNGKSGRRISSTNVNISLKSPSRTVSRVPSKTSSITSSGLNSPINNNNGNSRNVTRQNSSISSKGSSSTSTQKTIKTKTTS